ncbi:hypothetical protein ONZ51_g5947 [Trametes cubensis]|uniref:DUF6534 domain-containing protein n=1 Tax=Trametes cubensis TaxID=1111947 RepID=A0AAD7TT23_9APHY|nr:hypothetical protein ONZ51_g5947 [Trametes cubensis]
MVESLIQNSFNNFSKFQWMIWASISITMAFDIFLAIQFVLEYYYIKKQITSRGMVLVLGMLMAQMIHAGLSTSALVLTTLIYAIISPHELIWAAIMVVGTRVYLNVVLSFLNARQSLKDVLSDDNLGWGGGITALSRTPHTLDLRPGGRRLQQTQRRDSDCMRQVNHVHGTRTMIDVTVTTERYMDGGRESMRSQPSTMN